MGHYHDKQIETQLFVNNEDGKIDLYLPEYDIYVMTPDEALELANLLIEKAVLSGIISEVWRDTGVVDALGAARKALPDGARFDPLRDAISKEISEYIDLSGWSCKTRDARGEMDKRLAARHRVSLRVGFTSLSYASPQSQPQTEDDKE